MRREADAQIGTAQEATKDLHNKCAQLAVEVQGAQATIKALQDRSAELATKEQKLKTDLQVRWGLGVAKLRIEGGREDAKEHGVGAERGCEV